MLVVHDYLTQQGGAERVAIEMARNLSDGRLLTALYNPGTTYPNLSDLSVDVLPLNRVGLFRADPRRALPFLASAFSRVHLDEPVVVCSSSGWAHGISTSGHKIVYCHNPARWLYQTDQYLIGQPAQIQVGLRLLKPGLVRWDQRAAASPRTTYLANSTAVASRIRHAYGISAEVLHPPVMVEPAGPRAQWPELEPGFLLTVGRPRGYKRTDAVIEAMSELSGNRLVVVGSTGTDPERWDGQVLHLPKVSDAQLRWLYANASVLVAVGDEDFGLTPLEANAFGTPVVALAHGGYLDTVIDGVNGVLVESRQQKVIADGVRRCLSEVTDEDAMRAHAGRFSASAFTDRIRDIAAEATRVG